MFKLLLSLVKYLLKLTGLFVLIVGLLILGKWLWVEWEELKQIDALIAQKENLRENLESEIQVIERRMADREAQWQSERDETIRRLRNELANLEQSIQQAEAKVQSAIKKISDLDTIAAESRSAAREAERNLVHLKQKTRPWDPIFNREKYLEIGKAEGNLRLLKLKSATASRMQKQFRDSLATSPAGEYAKERTLKLQAIANAEKAISPEEAELRNTHNKKQADIKAINSLIGAERERIQQDPKQRILAGIIEQLPKALGILTLIICIPLLVKIILFYLVAPFVGRLKPVHITRQEDAPGIPAPIPSSVSLPLDIPAGEEILVHADFLQSTSQPAKKCTQYFLNARIPFTSIASGMCLLTRVQPDGDESTTVVVSSQHDPFGEIGLIEIPMGAAMVVHPRSLAGVIKPQDVPITITRHWRLFSIHAWLTLQLRYLAIHGPCKIILKGCRGVRAEEPDAGRPRVINQRATLGFSANLAYKNTRCETFISYLRGKEQLFNDQFTGSPGRFVYEEMPRGGKPVGILGRGVEGLVDAVLKVFGI